MFYKKAIQSEIPNHLRPSLILRREKKSFTGLQSSKGDIKQGSKDALSKQVSELEMHQIELQLQNEELMKEISFMHEESKKHKHVTEEYKEALEKYKNVSDKYFDLYEFAPSGFFTLSNEGEINQLNLDGARKLGKKRIHLLNSRFGFFLTPETLPIFNQFLSKVFSSKSRQNCKVTLSIDDQDQINVYLMGIVNENGEECLVNMVDITELKKAEQELIKAKEKSEEKELLKSKYLANMTHEIRTPLNGILGFTELLKIPDLSFEKQQKYINNIALGGERLLNTINDLLDISKMESGRMNVNVSACNVNEQIQYIFNFFKPEVERKGMNLFFQNSLPENEAVIQTDREKLLGILTNLVKNAIKYSEEGTIEFGYILKPATHPVHHKGKSGELEFFVKDTGIGIPPEKIEMVFERFKRAHDSGEKKSIQGAGLGLHISKEYVEMLGGKIWLKSIEGKGSTFYFTIPYDL